jgi:VIT1/CCC1 family predicted Fe2+/Mn2+ transporter
MSKEAPSWLAPVLGGFALTAISSSSNYYVSKETPTVKTVGRDFILGAIIMLLIMQLVPESVAKLMTLIVSVASIQLSTGTTKGGALLLEPSPSEEMEVRVGVPRF